jgi:hypothetical protein
MITTTVDRRFEDNDTGLRSAGRKICVYMEAKVFSVDAKQRYHGLLGLSTAEMGWTSRAMRLTSDDNKNETRTFASVNGECAGLQG